MSNSRTKNSFRNIFVNIACQLLTLVLSFFTRTVFIKILGADYLGINGLFSNILSVFSLAELGFGTAIVYNLYKYLADDNKQKIAANINFYGKIYKIIALIILILGLSLVPFLKYIINLKNDIPHIKVYYILFLLNSVISYLFVYKSAILNADQKNYITKTNNTIFLIITNVCQIFILYLTHNYILFLIVQLIITFTSNITIYLITENKYPYLKNSKELLSKEEKNKIIDNVKSLFLYKIGGVIMNNTTNIFISIFVSTTVVGYYSNYTLIFGIVVTFSELIFGGISASIGNFVATKSKKDCCRCFYMLNFANFWIYSLFSLLLFCIMSDFVELWIGKEYVLSNVVVFVICLNIFIPGMLSAVTGFRTATGMFRETKYVFIITAILNLLFIIILGKKFGLIGILISSVFARLLTNVWYEPYILITKKFQQSIKYFVIKILIYYMITISFLIIINVLKNLYFTLSWINFICEIVICFIVLNGIFYIFFCKTQEFKDLKIRLFSLLKKNN